MLQLLNNVLTYPHTRLVLVLLFTILAGNIVRPLPDMLDRLYTKNNMTSHLFKFVMLLMLALLTNGPVKDMNQLLYIGSSVVGVLIILHLFRVFLNRDHFTQYEEHYEENHDHQE